MSDRTKEEGRRGLITEAGDEVLNDILRYTRIKGSVYFCDSVRAPWGKIFDAPEYASFHMVRGGGCYLAIDERAYELRSGDFIYVEPGRRHALSSMAPETKAKSDFSQCMLLCGYCRFDDEPIHPLLRALPELIVLRDHELRRLVALKSILDQLSQEYIWRIERRGVFIDKLTEVMLVALLKHVCSRSERKGFLNALYDRPVSRALSDLHAEPEKSWTLSNMASSVGLSRAGLANRFRKQVGESVIDYLTQLRMRKARELLRASDMSIQRVASQIGYESDASFSKAFKRVVGRTPSSYRNQLSRKGDSGRSGQRIRV